jgi:hypothetical protein
MSGKSLLKTVAAVFVFVTCSWPQAPALTGVLKGVVRDTARKTVIGAASIRVTTLSGAVRGETTSNADGTYVLSGLVVGETVNSFYSAAGYAPDPWSHPLTLQPQTVQDVLLTCDCKDLAYWNAWADIQKASVNDAVNGRVPLDKEPAIRAHILQDSWRSLGYLGISAEARGAAARSLIAVEPVVGEDAALSAFAHADPKVLRTAEEQLHLKLAGGSGSAAVVSPEIDAEIVAPEIRKRHQFTIEASLGKETQNQVVAILARDPSMKALADHMVLNQKLSYTF